MSIELPPDPRLEQLVQEQLKTGRFRDAGDVLAAALRLLGERSRPRDVTPDAAFGLWKGRMPDGLAYEDAIRAEWGR